MDNSRAQTDNSLPLSKLVQIDQTADCFERAIQEAIQNGKAWPSAEDYLGDAPEPTRSELRKELLALEASYRQRVEKLLAAHAKAGNAFRPQVGTTGCQSTAPAAPRADTSGSVIAGRYKLLDKIGEGGMGEVWVAEQTQPVRRKVALKLIKPGMDSKSVLARFEAERQALAVMDHPSIAKVLDGGLTGSGRPYFVMEYVKGIPITEYCDTARLGIAERLNLFVQVCSAVQHAHQKGIVHRDLKPSNILVALHDNTPVPKVIDFGLAKALHFSLTERTLHTAHETIVGTPLYMSPEQAQLNNLDVDTRSDIYSLGVLLYELLTGTTPLEKQRLKDAAWDEVRRIIREEEPPRPSTRLSSTDKLPSLAACRQTEPTKLTMQLRGELDWIAMKALEKDRSRRYETANGLSRDIQRYLSDEVVEARPPSNGYRLQKFLRRYKGQVIAAGLVLLALLAGITGTTFGLIQARQQEKLAGERLIQVEDEKKKVEEEKQIAQAVRDFLQNKLLRQTDPHAQADALLAAGDSSTKQKPNPTIRELLDRAALELAPNKIEANFPRQPLLQAELLKTVGDTYGGVGEYGRAIAFLARATDLRKANLGPDHADTLTVLNNLAMAYQDAGKLPQAIELFEQVRDALVKKLGADHQDTLTVLNNLAVAYKVDGKLPQAIKLYEQVRDASVKKLGADHSHTLFTLNNLALAYQKAGKLLQAIELFEQVRDALVKKLGADHPDTLSTLNNLALAYQAAGKLPHAIELLEQVRDAKVKKLGADHPATLITLNNLALAYNKAGKPLQAIELYEQVHNGFVKKLGADHPSTLIALINLAEANRVAGRLSQALPLFEQAATGIERLNYQHEFARNVIPIAIQTYEVANQYAKAETWRRKWLAVVKEKDGAGSSAYGGELASLGLNLLRQKKWSDAEPILRECLELREKLLEKKQAAPWQVASVKSMLGEALLAQKKTAEAEPLLVAGFEGLKQDENAIPVVARQERVTEAIQRLIDLAVATNRPGDVKKWQAEQAKYPAQKPVEKK